jgi:hypothetical protein
LGRTKVRQRRVADTERRRGCSDAQVRCTVAVVAPTNPQYPIECTSACLRVATDASVGTRQVLEQTPPRRQSLVLRLSQRAGQPEHPRRRVPVPRKQDVVAPARGAVATSEQQIEGLARRGPGWFEREPRQRVADVGHHPFVARIDGSGPRGRGAGTRAPRPLPVRRTDHLACEKP